MQSIFKSLVSLLIVLVTGAAALAQTNSVGVTLSITPPYSPRLSDYAEQPGKLVLILKNNAGRQMQVYLKATITGDNGVAVATKANYKPPQPLVLQINQLLQADINVLRDLFDDSKLTYTHISAEDIIKKNGIPEGNYQVCIQVFDYNTGLPVSDLATGCRQIRIASLEPPVLMKPLENESIKPFQPQSLLFSWTVPAGAEPGTKYRLRIVEILEPKRNINEVYRNATPFYETEVSANVLLYGPSQPPLVKGRKYAWAVTALPGPKGSAYRNRGLSVVRGFVFGETLPAPVADMVKLVYPADKASVTPDPNPVKNYTTWDYDPSLAGGMENPIVVVIGANQSPEEALQKNQNIAGGKEPYKQSFVDFTKYAGKTLAWKVTVNVGGKIYSSKVQTFTILPDDKASKDFNSFVLAGFPVTVHHLNNTGGFVFNGTGTTHLYKGGPSVEITFDNLTIQPFDADVTISKDGTTPNKKGTNTPVKVYKRWIATSGSAKPVKRPSGKFDFKVSDDVGGSAWFSPTDISYSAGILSKWDETRGYFVQIGTGKNTAYYTGVFTWKTGFLARTKQGTDEMIAFSSIKEQTFEFGFENKFKSGGYSELRFEGPGGTNIITPSFTKNTTIKLVPTLNFDGADKVSFQFDGSYEIIHPKKSLKVSFEKQKALSFDVFIPKGWQQMLNTDGSVMAYFDNVHVDIAKNLFGLNIPDITLLLSYKGKQFKFIYKDATFSDELGLLFGSEKDESQQVTLMGFPVITKKSLVSVANTALIQFSLDGDLVVPVINQKAGVNFFADEKGLQKAEMAFVTGQTTTLYNSSKTGDQCTFTASYGTITEGKIIVGGSFSFSNAGTEKNLNVADVQVEDFTIYADGHISLTNPWGKNALTHPQGNFNGYTFTANGLAADGSAAYGYSLRISGVVTLADNFGLGATIDGNNFNSTVNFNATDITSNGVAYASNNHGPSPGDAEKQKQDNDEISFSTEAKASTDNESSAFYGASLKFYDHDDNYGTGFRTEVNYALKSPADPQNKSAPSIKAVLWIGHMSEGYNYWYLEAGQKNVVVVPTGVLDLSINGFTGRIFYHMRHEGDNINNNNTYVPDDSKFIGLYGQVNLKTATDDGIKFWGDLSFEITSTSQGPESITLLGNGNFITTGEGTDGILQAKDCKLVITSTPEAKIYGDFTGIMSAAGVVTVKANAGFEISKSVFHIWGTGSGSFMGKEAPASCGFDLDQNRVKVMGKYNLVDINWHNEGLICNDDVVVKATIALGAEVVYWPFQFNGEASFSGSATLKECGETILSLGFNLTGQVQFPNPVCVSVGVSIGGFDIDAGIRNGKFIFEKCF
jgi:TANFOR domain-containing protein